jgi:tRNA-binding protein
MEARMPEPISIADFAKIELRTAKILEAKPHPNADKLLVLQVDVGGERKQICAGIKLHYAPEELVGKTIVVVNNLQTAVLRGEESQGMLLAASDADSVVLLKPERDMPSGCVVK